MIVNLPDKETLLKPFETENQHGRYLDITKDMDDFISGVNTVYAAAREITDEELDGIVNDWTYNMIHGKTVPMFSGYLKERIN